MVTLLVLFILGTAEGQSWVWGTQGTTYSDPQVRCIAADSKGNVYSTGYFRDSISFGTYHLTSTLYDAFLVKYDSSGNILWLRQSNTSGGTPTYDQCTVTTDASDNIYISGEFTGTIHFGSITLASSSWAIFLVKFNANGTPIWGVQTMNTTSGYEFANSITTDDSANVFITGSFADSITFGPIKFHSNVATVQLFIAKYDSSGNVCWAKASKGYSNHCIGQGNAVSCDASGNAYVTGIFMDTISISSLTFTSLACPCIVYPYYDMFLLKYDGNGNLIWGKQTNAQPPNGSINAQSVINDRYGNVYVTGQFQDTVIIGGFTIIGAGTFLTKYDFNGNAVWVKTAGFGGWAGYSPACDRNDNLYFSCGANGSTYPTENFCNENLSINGATDPSIFLKLDTAGNAFSGSIIRTGGDDENYIACSPNGKYVYVGGDIWDTITFGNNLLNNLGTETPFLARLEFPGNPESIFEITNQLNSLSLFPNPNTGVFTLEVNSEKLKVNSVEVYNVMGQKVYSTPSQQPMNVHSTFMSRSEGGASFTYPINMCYAPSGVYLYRVVNENGALVGEGKFVIEK